jgi:Ca2+-binding RTX toxin-like protein
MSSLHRKALTAAGFTVAAVASTALFAVPAQAASAGAAKVVGSSTVQFNALMGKSNGLTITISGRTVTLDDKVAIKAGRGCKAVRGDKTKVKCTTKKKTTKLSIALGDKTDWVRNKTSVYMLADGGSGTDSLTGGSGKDQLQGGTGNDKLYGQGGNDTFFGDSGNDSIVGGTGNDRVDAGSGTDKVWSESGNDEVGGGTGNDTIAGGTGNDELFGDSGNDRITGSTGDDYVSGDAGNDQLFGDTGKDGVIGGPGNDSISGNDGDDFLYGLAGNDKIAGNAGDDFLVAEDVLTSGTQIGSNSATDRLDGGANATAEGDLCLVMDAGIAVNCESVRTDAVGTAGSTWSERVKAAEVMVTRVQNARAAR